MYLHPQGSNSSPPAAEKEGEGSHIPGWGHSPLPPAWFRVQTAGLAGMHREREGTAEAAVRSHRVQMSAEVMHRAADPFHPSLPRKGT